MEEKRVPVTTLLILYRISMSLSYYQDEIYLRMI